MNKILFINKKDLTIDKIKNTKWTYRIRLTTLNPFMLKSKLKGNINAENAAYISGSIGQSLLKSMLKSLGQGGVIYTELKGDSYSCELIRIHATKWEKERLLDYKDVDYNSGNSASVIDKQCINKQQ